MVLIRTAQKMVVSPKIENTSQIQPSTSRKTLVQPIQTYSGDVNCVVFCKKAIFRDFKDMLNMVLTRKAKKIVVTPKFEKASQIQPSTSRKTLVQPIQTYSGDVNCLRFCKKAILSDFEGRVEYGSHQNSPKNGRNPKNRNSKNRKSFLDIAEHFKKNIGSAHIDLFRTRELSALLQKNDFQ